MLPVTYMIRCWDCNTANNRVMGKGTTSKPNRWLPGGFVRFRPVSIVLNNDNRPEPKGTAGQPAVGFWSRPWADYERYYLEAC